MAERPMNPYFQFPELDPVFNPALMDSGFVNPLTDPTALTFEDILTGGRPVAPDGTEISDLKRLLDPDEEGKRGDRKRNRAQIKNFGDQPLYGPPRSGRNVGRLDRPYERPFLGLTMSEDLLPPADDPTYPDYAPPGTGTEAFVDPTEAPPKDKTPTIADEFRKADEEIGGSFADPARVPDLIEEEVEPSAFEDPAAYLDNNRSAIARAMMQGGAALASNTNPTIAGGLSEGMMAGLEGWDTAKAQERLSENDDLDRLLKETRLRNAQEQMENNRIDRAEAREDEQRRRLIEDAKLAADGYTIDPDTGELTYNDPNALPQGASLFEQVQHGIRNAGSDMERQMVVLKALANFGDQMTAEERAYLEMLADFKKAPESIAEIG